MKKRRRRKACLATVSAVPGSCSFNDNGAVRFIASSDYDPPRPGLSDAQPRSIGPRHAIEGANRPATQQTLTNRAPFARTAMPASRAFRAVTVRPRAAAAGAGICCGLQKWRIIVRSPRNGGRFR
ncbi:MAG: hypothetical protein IPL03_04615 [Sterolibacteriaceae bacterium]|nr:hypothetical protein [Candidatus Methylophosphatis haderslevensis]